MGVEFLPLGFKSERIRFSDGVLVANWINTIFARLNPWAAVVFLEVNSEKIHFQSGPRTYVLQFDPFSVCEIDLDGKTYSTDAARRVAQELDGWQRDDDGNRNPPPGYFPRRPNDDPRPLPPAMPKAAGNWQTLCDNADRVADAAKPATLPLKVYTNPKGVPLSDDLAALGWRSMDEAPLQTTVTALGENGEEYPAIYCPKNGRWMIADALTEAGELVFYITPTAWKPQQQPKPAKPIGPPPWRPIETAPPDTRVSIVIEGGRSYTGWLDSADGRWRAVSPWSGRPDIVCGVTPIGWLPQ